MSGRGIAGAGRYVRYDVDGAVWRYPSAGTEIRGDTTLQGRGGRGERLSPRRGDPADLRLDRWWFDRARCVFEHPR